MWCFSCFGGKVEEDCYEGARAATNDTPVLQRHTLRVEERVTYAKFEEVAVSVCHPSEALCEGQVHSLMEHSAFDPPLCSTKLVDDVKQRSLSDSHLLVDGDGSLSKSFWEDIHRRDKKGKRERRRTIGGPFSESSQSPVSTPFCPLNLASFDAVLTVIKEENTVKKTVLSNLEMSEPLRTTGDSVQPNTDEERSAARFTVTQIPTPTIVDDAIEHEWDDYRKIDFDESSILVGTLPNLDFERF